MTKSFLVLRHYLKPLLHTSHLELCLLSFFTYNMIFLKILSIPYHFFGENKHTTLRQCFNFLPKAVDERMIKGLLYHKCRNYNQCLKFFLATPAFLHKPVRSIRRYYFTFLDPLSLSLCIGVRLRIRPGTCYAAGEDEDERAGISERSGGSREGKEESPP